jgi:simple sugar transport system substrate-binding protein/basic membrane protein A
VGFKDGANPFVESKLGKGVPSDTAAAIATAKTLISTTGSPFTGPVMGQDGKTLITAGTVPDYATIESTMTVFVQGVVGDLPKS